MPSTEGMSLTPSAHQRLAVAARGVRDEGVEPTLGAVRATEEIADKDSDGRRPA